MSADPNDYMNPGSALAVLQALDRFDESAPLNEGLLIDLVRAVASSGSTEGVDLPTPSEDPPVRQIGWFRRYVAEVAQCRKQAVTEVVHSAMTSLVLELRGQELDERRRETDKMTWLARAYLPDYQDMEVLLRYKRQIEGSIDRHMKALEHSQRARNNDLPAPIRLEVSEG